MAKRVFPEVRQLDFPQLERDILERWKEQSIFDKTLQNRKNGPTFTFYEGPPTANGRPGIHHVMARTIKDTFCRYKTMKGFMVNRKAGWDTHGLPVEIEVEKTLKLEGRHQVESYGIAKYNQACKDSVLKYKDLWDTLTTRMGYWVNLDTPYVTFDTTYIETLWWLLKQIYDKGLLYQGYKIQWYSPGSETVLSSHEVSLGYKETQDPSVYVRFPLKSVPNTSFLAWTTTPWTLVSNAALAVGPKIEYVKVRLENDGKEEFLILAADLIHVLEVPCEEVERIKGSDLVGLEYHPLFAYFQEDEGVENAWKVIGAPFVSTSDGTGIVHIAPAFGADDHLVGQQENLPLLNPVRPNGTFDEQAELVANLWFKDADRPIVRDLIKRGLLFREKSYVHNYPHDWRKGTPLMQYPVESWFIRTTAVRERMMELNATINWQPETIGSGRFGQWLENNIDWALSRSRYWGTPLPIWKSDAPESGHVEIIGSIAELREKCADQLPEDDADLDLHRPFVDQLTWPAPDGGTMRRIPDLIDVWFDSGAMPFAQWHYPFENKDQFEANFPADFIAEGVDQTRGWFYTLHAISTLVMDSVAFKNVISNGLLLDEAGEKMSKSKGNTVDPFESIAKHGADPLRWYLMSNSPPWEDLRFSDRGIDVVQRKFFNTLANTYNFFATYANIDSFTFDGESIPLAERSELDRWILSRMNTTIQEVDEEYRAYHPTRAARLIEKFVDELSNWYIRRSRRRFWKSEHDADKDAAFQTVYECLETVSRLMAPISPFVSEWLYDSLVSTTRKSTSESVHLTDFPESVPECMDAALEHRMGLARTIASTVLALRNLSDVQINVRQPLQRIMVVTDDHTDAESVRVMTDVILSEVNVKEIEFVGSSSDIVHKSARPNFKVLGRRLGKQMKPVADAVKNMTSEEIKIYEETGVYSVQTANDEIVLLTAGDIEIQSEGIEGWQVGTEDGVTVALDTNITEDLLAEGFTREVVNRIQNMRKSASFDVTDRISVQFSASETLHKAMGTFLDWIQSETLALSLQPVEIPEGDFIETFSIGDQTLSLAISRISS